VLRSRLRFSQKLRALRLTASEQRVLSLVDRQNPLRAVTQRSGLPAREVARILYRLSEIELIQPLVVAAPAASAVSGNASAVSAGAGVSGTGFSGSRLHAIATGYAERARPAQVAAFLR